MQTPDAHHEDRQAQPSADRAQVVKKKLWNQSIARHSLLGHETETMNPSIAARSLLGETRSRLAEKKRRKYKRSFHRGNPALATAASLVPGGGIVSGILGGLSGLGGRFKKPSEVRAAALAPAIVQSANAGNLTAARGLLERAALPMIAKEHAVWQSAAAQLAPNIVAAVKQHMKEIPAADQKSPEAFAQSVTASPVQVPGAPVNPLLAAVQTPQGVALAGKILTVATRRSRRRGYYPTYMDRYGRQRYSRQPPGAQLRIPEGATPSPDTPYNFFRSDVGRGGAAATLGQVAVAGAAGIGAYLVTKRLLEHLGGAAQKKEEAGVQAALALHEALEDYKKQKGAYPPPAERAQMKEAYRAKLVELGYNPDTFERTRSGVEGFLESYNPFGG
jgi:hypothetical protein